MMCRLVTNIIWLYSSYAIKHITMYCAPAVEYSGLEGLHLFSRSVRVKSETKYEFISTLHDAHVQTASKRAKKFHTQAPRAHVLPFIECDTCMTSRFFIPTRKESFLLLRTDSARSDSASCTMRFDGKRVVSDVQTLNYFLHRALLFETAPLRLLG